MKKNARIFLVMVGSRDGRSKVRFFSDASEKIRFDYECGAFRGRSVVYAVTVNYLYMDRVRVRVSIRVSIRVSGRVTDRVRFRVRVRLQILQAMYCYGVNYTTPAFRSD